eukprot:4917711-Amphidinium_carterae.1
MGEQELPRPPSEPTEIADNVHKAHSGSSRASPRPKDKRGGLVRHHKPEGKCSSCSPAWHFEERSCARPEQEAEAQSTAGGDTSCCPYPDVEHEFGESTECDLGRHPTDTGYSSAVPDICEHSEPIRSYSVTPQCLE